MDQRGEREISSCLDKKLLLHWILSPLRLLMRKFASLILRFTLLNVGMLLQATELANVMLNAGEDRMFYAVVSANEICLFLELLEVWLL